jgi:hypothetical protein
VVRRLIGVLVVVAIIVGGLALGDIWVRHRVQTVLASHIQSEFPGSRAAVDITSFPFVGRLAVSGTVPKLTADVTGVQAGGFTFATIDVVVDDLKVDTSKLTSRRLVLQSISSGSVTADVTQASIDQQTKVPITLGSGTVELAGYSIRPTLSVSGTQVTISVAPLPSVTISIPVLSILPCVGAAVIVPGALRLSCSLTALPPVLAGFTAAF